MFAIAIGHLIQGWVPPSKRGAETIVVVRSVIAILITFTALILSLLLNSVKNSFDLTNYNTRIYASQIIDLDKILRSYGTPADPLRKALKSYVLAQVANPAGTGRMSLLAEPDDDAGSNLENRGQGEMISSIEAGVRDLNPGDREHQLVADDARHAVRRLTEMRWQLIESQHRDSAIPMPFLTLVIVWLSTIFGSFGFNEDKNFVIHSAVLLVDASLGSVLFLIVDLDSHFRGLQIISTSPYRDALSHLEQ